MIGLIDFLAALYASGDLGKTMLLAMFIMVLFFLFIDILGKYEAKKKCPVDHLYGRLRNGYLHHWHNWGSEGLSGAEIILQKRLMDGGLDWILETCITHNIQRISKIKPIGFKFSDIERVTAAWAGYIQGQRKWTIYRWIIELQDGQFIYLRGWFDPARGRGEPRTNLFTWSADTAEEAAQIEIQSEKLSRKRRSEKGHDKLIDQEVYEALLDQIKSGERDWAGFKWDTLYAP